MAASTTIPIQDIAALANADIDLAAADGTDDNRFIADGRTLLVVKNASGAERTVTVVSVAEGRFGRIGNLSLVVPDGETHILPPLPATGFNQPSGDDAGYTQVSVDSATSVSYGAVRPAAAP